MEFLRDNQIPIEVSPTSNYHLRIINPTENHPVRDMVDSGLLCTINTDDPAMFSTHLSKEFELLYDQGFSLAELHQLNLNAIRASFLDAGEKSALRKILNEY